MEKLIIFGGTFDPIHNGHLRIARYASLNLNADVCFVIAKSPRWKKPEANITDRYNMLQLAIKKDGTPSFSISKYEMESNKEINHTIDTIRYFKDKYKDREICLLIGADQVSAFDKWQNAEDIAKLSNIIYVSRPDIVLNHENIKKFNMQRLDFDKSGEVSSNKIRNLLSLDTPKEVIDYIAEHNLYYMEDLINRYSPKRLKHAISVANLSYQIAKNNNEVVDAGNAYIAGLLHDVGKKLDENEQRNIMQNHFTNYLTNLPPSLYHQFVGAYIAKENLGIKDPNILDAIMFHATGKDHMTPLGKIIYSADKIDPLRGYNSKKLIKLCLKDYYEGFQTVLRENRKYLLKKGCSINNPLTEKCIQLYLGENL